MEEHKKWAVGLSQTEFEREYCNRFPWGMDTIPDVNEWLSFENGKPDIIDAFNPELMVEEFPESVLSKKERQEEVEQKSQFYCRGCKREFKYRVAQAGHERKCKAFLNTRA
ncbi:MAG: hypothetical protein KGJ89_05055 [Patescibacteria group bacterium]|nr:hypothetical protein [Patescibacteria group bacterium]MDE2227290.1 hypothetical protein [Patescibacteria group bacterium]